MANWKVNINVGEYFKQFNDERKDTNNKEFFIEIRNKIVERLREHLDEIKNKINIRTRDIFEGIVNKLSLTKSMTSFNKVWTALYDWCDYSLIWINTF